jgi:DNA gyrase subunit A
MVSRQGMTIRFSEDDVRPMGRATAGVRGMKLKSADDGVVSCDVAREDGVLLFVSSGGYGKRTAMSAFNRQGRGGQGVRGMRLKSTNDAVVSSDVARDEGVLLFVSSSGHGKRTPIASFNRQGRGGQGVRGMRVTEARGVVVSAFIVSPGDEIIVFSSAGNLIRMGVDEISEQGRDATGVRVARVEEGDTVVAVARVLEAEQAEAEPGEES